MNAKHYPHLSLEQSSNYQAYKKSTKIVEKLSIPGFVSPLHTDNETTKAGAQHSCFCNNNTLISTRRGYIVSLISVHFTPIVPNYRISANMAFTCESLSLFNATTSIWRIRSRVTDIERPTCSSVHGSSPPMPNLNRTTFSSRGLST